MTRRVVKSATTGRTYSKDDPRYERNARIQTIRKGRLVKRIKR